MVISSNPVAKAFLSLQPEALWVADHGIVLNDFWNTLTNVSTSGEHNRTLTKTGGGAAWNATGVSCVVLTGDGWVEFGTNEVSTIKLAGLSADNPDNIDTTVDYAIYLTNTASGYFAVMENGTVMTGWTGFTPIFKFKINRTGTTITYLYNSGAGWTLFYTSLIASTGPLIFDSSLHSVGATLTDINLWGTLSSVGPFGNIVNCQVVGGTITKTAGGAVWNAGASSGYAIYANGYVEFTTNEDGLAKVAGLSHTDPDAVYTSIEYGINFDAAGAINIYEMGGLAAGGISTWVAGDRFRVQRAGTTITYEQLITGTWTVIYTSLVACPAGPLLFDSSILDVNGTLEITGWSGESKRVLKWKDLTTDGYDLVQTLVGKQPLWDPKDGIAPFLYFSGANVLSGGPVGLDGGDYSIVVVAEYTGPTLGVGASSFVLCDGIYGTDGVSIRFYAVAGPSMLDLMSNSAPFVSSYSTAPVSGLAHGDFWSDAANIKCNWNCLAWGTSNAATLTPPTTSLVIGGVDTTPSLGLIGKVYMVAMRSPRFTDSELAILSKIITQHYGVA